MKLKDVQELLPYFTRQEFPAKTIILHEGKISKRMFFIEKGCLRTWVNNVGQEVTTQFFFEGDGISSFENFITNEPSLYSIETIESCTLQTISKGDFQKIVDNNRPELKQKMGDHAIRRLFEVQHLFYAYLKNNPQKRYEELLVQYPRIVQRIPQYYIASYLGITPVS